MTLYEEYNRMWEVYQSLRLRYPELRIYRTGDISNDIEYKLDYKRCVTALLEDIIRVKDERSKRISYRLGHSLS